MMKRFISALLGSLAAIWISVILLFFLLILFIAAIISNSFNSQTVALSFKDKSILHIELAGTFVERPAEPDLMSEIYGTQESTIPLNDLIASISAAADDDKIEGIFLDCKGSSGGIAQRTELIEALEEFKESGKWIVAYADSYTQADYYIASTATEIYLNPVGMLDIHGLSATTMFYKGLLDKLGIEMQIIKVGTFKSAVEPFILTSASEPSKLQQQVFLDNIWDVITNQISASRDIPVEEINTLADSMMLTFKPSDYVDYNFIDGLKYRREVIDMLKSQTDIDNDKDLRLISPENYVLVADVPHAKRNDNRIAVLYAVGDIVDEGNGGIVAAKLVPQILKLKENKKIDGLILRVNSGGGSAFASEQIWEALEQFKSTGRPFYVSMSDYAASGGYYISSGADRIYADPTTLTGSIGIFGMIPCAKEFMNDKLGITTDNVSTNLNGDFPSLMEPMTPFQREAMQREINRGYETFVGRCAKGRHMPVDSILAIAEGRVWDGQSALRIGLVDRLGSLSTVIADMANDLDFGDKYCVIEYPDPTPTLWEAVTGSEVSVKERIIRQELGDSYLLYKQIDYIRNAAHVQCRMEDIIVE
ncbi:MAG: signal peptide peptidase SppA [Muribaculaceae bacterium]|nr:signal peptide peptidase SppA [Muribaculaceae bacterium]